MRYNTYLWSIGLRIVTVGKYKPRVSCSDKYDMYSCIVVSLHILLMKLDKI